MKTKTPPHIFGTFSERNFHKRPKWGGGVYSYYTGICLTFFLSQVILSIICTVYSFDHNLMNCTQDLYYFLSSLRIVFSDLLGAVCLLNFAWCSGFLLLGSLPLDHTICFYVELQKQVNLIIK